MLNTPSMPSPIYTPGNVESVAYQLRYGWHGWPSSPAPSSLPVHLLTELDSLWESDGLRRLEGNWTPESIRFTFSVTPAIAPVTLASRVKGRLQHALRTSGSCCPISFSRKLSVRSIGDAVREDIERYVRAQVAKEPLVDPLFRQFLQQFTVTDPQVDLRLPTETRSGRYWYNLHLFVVAQQRFRTARPEHLEKLRDLSLRIAARKGYGLSTVSVMPDHIHLALRGHIEHSPEQIALAFMNNLAYAMGQNAVWEHGYYAGTFGEYDMGALRRG